MQTTNSATRTKQKFKYSRYCEFSYECNKEINCRTEPFCCAFRSSETFSTLPEKAHENERATQH